MEEASSSFENFERFARIEVAHIASDSASAFERSRTLITELKSRLLAEIESCDSRSDIRNGFLQAKLEHMARRPLREYHRLLNKLLEPTRNRLWSRIVQEFDRPYQIRVRQLFIASLQKEWKGALGFAFGVSLWIGIAYWIWIASWINNYWNTPAAKVSVVGATFLLLFFLSLAKRSVEGFMARLPGTRPKSDLSLIEPIVFPVEVHGNTVLHRLNMLAPGAHYGVAASRGIISSVQAGSIAPLGRNLAITAGLHIAFRLLPKLWDALFGPKLDKLKLDLKSIVSGSLRKLEANCDFDMQEWGLVQSYLYGHAMNRFIWYECCRDARVFEKEWIEYSFKRKIESERATAMV